MRKLLISAIGAAGLLGLTASPAVSVPDVTSLLNVTPPVGSAGTTSFTATPGLPPECGAGTTSVTLTVKTGADPVDSTSGTAVLTLTNQPVTTDKKFSIAFTLPAGSAEGPYSVFVTCNGATVPQVYGGGLLLVPAPPGGGNGGTGTTTTTTTTPASTATSTTPTAAAVRATPRLTG